MGKKTKTGKARKDKFYQLAKESGYRSRAAFKLLQLNRQFGFLQRSKVLVDLCAAPGGWLQVAREHMPMSSLVIGVDLVPIRSIGGVKTIQSDITSDACRQALRRELQSWKADVVLHDGAPNVGKAWLHDEFQQAQLVHQSFRLATELLRKGGWFISKVFRSQDYDKLKFVLLQLFDQVKAVKPEASRQESAEIYLVCRGYKAPDKIDPAFFDTGRVFGEVGTCAEAAERQAHKVLFGRRNESRKAKPLGYEAGEAVFQRLRASDFLRSENHLQLLARASEIVLDLEEIENHNLTTPEIRECCKDIKVLSKSDIKMLINWRRKLLKRMEKIEKQVAQNSGNADESSDMKEQTKDVNEQTEEEKIEEQIVRLQEEERKDAKKKMKKIREKKRQLHERIQLKMVNPGDRIEQTDDVDLFSLSRVRGGLAALNEITETSRLPEVAPDEEELPVVPKKRVRFERDSPAEVNPEWSATHKESASEDELSDSEDLQKLRNALVDERCDHLEDEEMEEEEDEEDKEIPLLQTLEEKEDRASRIERDWFSQELFEGCVDEEMDDDDDEEEEESDAEPQPSTRKPAVAVTNRSNGIPATSGDKGKQVTLGKRKLTPEELAVGTRLIYSSKSRRELEEASYHRYMFEDGGQLPKWFVEDERKHMRRPVEALVSRREVRQQASKFKDINARTIKKVAEAKARKKRKAERRLDRTRKKAADIVEDSELQDRERWNQVRQVYKKAGLLGNRRAKRPAAKLLVAKKGGGLGGSGGKKLPKGTRVKRVDARMKKDSRSHGAGKGKGKGGKHKK